MPLTSPHWSRDRHLSGARPVKESANLPKTSEKKASDCCLRDKALGAEMQTTYVGGPTLTNGSPNCTAYQVTLFPNETLTAAFGTWTSCITQISFNTSYSRTLGPYGSSAGQTWSFSGLVYGLYGEVMSTFLQTCISTVGFYTTVYPPTPPAPALPPTVATPIFPPGAIANFDDGPHAGDSHICRIPRSLQCSTSAVLTQRL